MKRAVNPMHIRREFPFEVEETEHTWITLADGTHLSARLWLPLGAGAVPALLEYIPYRKNDGTAVRDAIRHPYLAGHGYACVRVDLRGSGESDGLLLDEYLPQELNDGVEVIAWIARQPWCDGNVGMFGKSWGGFNALQVAALRPPALKAIITICSTDDRYADDVHYMGGCVLASEMLSWASYMLNYNAAPPDPRWVGGRWREIWLQRMAQTPPFVEAWLSHQRRDAFWQHGSVCENYADIEIPVYAVGGWADGYTNAIFRLLAGLPGPRKGLIGPWGHNFPEDSSPQPAIGFLQESLRWWDHWLKGVDTGIMDEPMLTSWVQESVLPQTAYAERPGRWVNDPSWPSPHVAEESLDITEAGLRLAEMENITPLAVVQKLEGMQTHGLAAPRWLTFGDAGDFAIDQRADDGCSLTFDTEPLAASVDVLGFPYLDVLVSVDRPVALLAVRLCDVAPTGASTLVSWGLLNLNSQDGHAQAAALEPGKPYMATVQLNAIGHNLPAGHRWRLALSPTYWPHAWPSPETVVVTVHGGRLRLPVRPRQPDDGATFAPPECAPHLALDVLRTPRLERKTMQNLVTGEARVDNWIDSGRVFMHGNDLEFESTALDRYDIVEGEPLSATVVCERTRAWKRDTWEVRVHTRSTMTASATHFYLTNEVEGFEGAGRVFAKTWSTAIPRHFV